MGNMPIAQKREREKPEDNPKLAEIREHKRKVQLLRSKMPPLMRSVIEYRDSGLTWKEVGLLLNKTAQQCRELYKRAAKYAEQVVKEIA